MRSISPYAARTVFGFDGRIGRRQFALSVVYQVGLTLVVSAVFFAFAGAKLAEALADQLAGAPTSVNLRDLYGEIAFVAIAQTALSVLTLTTMRARLHDIEMSVWWTVPISLPSFVVFVGPLFYTGVNAAVFQAIGISVTLLFLALLALLPGMSGDNVYGPPPRLAPVGASEDACSGEQDGCRPTVPA